MIPIQRLVGCNNDGGSRASGGDPAGLSGWRMTVWWFPRERGWSLYDREVFAVLSVVPARAGGGGDPNTNRMLSRKQLWFTRERG